MESWDQTDALTQIPACFNARKIEPCTDPGVESADTLSWIVSAQKWEAPWLAHGQEGGIDTV